MYMFCILIWSLDCIRVQAGAFGNILQIMCGLGLREARLPLMIMQTIKVGFNMFENQLL
jgi:hypothetical protein